MSSFDDRVQRAIAAAMREHLQYHLDDQQIEQVIADVHVHVDPPTPQQQDDCCDIVLDLLQQILRILNPWEKLRRALQGDPTEETTLPDVVNPSTEVPSVGELSKPRDVPTLPQDEPWDFGKIIWDALKRGITAGSQTPGASIPSLPLPTLPALPAPWVQQISNTTVNVLSLGDVGAMLRDLERKVDTMWEGMQHCCEEMNRKLDKLVPPDPEKPVEPNIPQEDPWEEGDIGEIIPRLQEEEPELEFSNTEVQLTPCNDMTLALSALERDELLAILIATDLYDYDVTVKVSTVKSNVTASTTVLTSADVNDVYIAMKNGEYVYDEVVQRSVDYYMTKHTNVQAEDIVVTTWIHYWPIDRRCGEGYTNVYTDRNFVARPPEMTTEGEIPHGDVIIRTISGDTIETGYHTTKGGSYSSSKDKQPVRVTSPSTEPSSSGATAQYDIPVSTPGPLIADHDVPRKPLTDESGKILTSDKIRVSEDESIDSFMIWPAGATYTQPAVATGIEVGSKLTPEELRSLGFNEADIPNHPVVVTDVQSTPWQAGFIKDPATGTKRNTHYGTITVSTTSKPSVTESATEKMRDKIQGLAGVKRLKDKLSSKT